MAKKTKIFNTYQKRCTHKVQQFTVLTGLYVALLIEFEMTWFGPLEN